MAIIFNKETGRYETDWGYTGESPTTPIQQNVNVGADNRNVLRSLQRLTGAGVNVPPQEPQPSLLEKTADLLSRGEYLSATTAGNLLKYGQLPTFQNMMDALTGKSKYTYSQLLGEMGMPEGFGKKALGLGLGILGDPLTYIPLSWAGKAIKPLATLGKKLPLLEPAITGIEDLGKWATRAWKVKGGANEGAKELETLLQGVTGRIGMTGEKTAKEYGDLLESIGKLSQKERVLVGAAKETPEMVAQLSPEAQKTLNLLNQMITQTGQVKSEAGTVGGLLEQYLPHITTDEFKQVIRQQGGTPQETLELLKGLIRTNLPKVEKERTLKGSIDTLNKWAAKKFGVKMFEEDVGKIVPRYLTAYARNKSLMDLSADLLKITDDAGSPLIKQVGEEAPAGLVKLTGLPFEGKYAADPDVARMINRTLGVLSSDETLNKFVKGFDQLMRMWKTGVTVYWPSFHLTNLMGASFNNFIESPTSLTHIADTFKVLREQPIEIVAKNGNKITGKELIDQMSKKGALLTFFGGETIPSSNLGRSILEKATKSLTRAGTGVESIVRTQLAIDVFKRTGSINDAIRAVWKVHGNYAPEAMTTLEREGLRRLIPFWTWMRTNIPFQIENLINKTGRYAALAKTKREFLPSEANLPDYIRGQLVFGNKALPTGKRAVSTGQLPIMDLLKLGQPGQLAGSLNPFLRSAIELGLNKQFYTGQEIVNPNLPPEMQTVKAMPMETWPIIRQLMGTKSTMKKNTMTGAFEPTQETNAMRAYVLRNLLGPIGRFSYMVRGAEKAQESLGEEGTGATILANLFSAISPFRTQTYSPEEQAYYSSQAYKAKLQEMINYLLKRNVIQPLR